MAPYPKSITVSRQHLFEEVWATPVSKLAPKYGLSDVSFAQTCRDHNIPRPGRGYWAKVAHGHAATKVPLPPSRNHSLEQVSFYLARSPEECEAVAAIRKRADRFGSITALPRGAELRHPLCQKTARYIQTHRPHYASRYRRPHLAAPVVDVRVSDDEVERALRVMDALLIALESEGFRVGVGLLGGYSQTFADVDGERIGFFVDICRAGICFQLSGPLLCRRWGDTTRKTLESRVGEFANAIVAAAPLIRAARARREAEEEAAHAEQARREAAEIARITERNRRRSALRELKQLRRASELRAYAKALGTRHPQSPKVREWATWIGGFADAIDPLKSDPEDLRSVVPEPVKLPEPKVNQWGWPILR